MPIDVAAEIAARLTGCRLKSVVRREYDWVFSFENGLSICVWALWRIVAEGRNCLCSEDHGHQFGLPAPVDGVTEAERHLRDKPVQLVLLRTTGDLTIGLDGDVALEVIQTSAGYEAWELTSPGLRVVAQGGGQLAIWAG